MKQLQRCAYAAVALLIALASVLMFSGVDRAQAATVGNVNTVPLGGTALDDQFKAVLRDGDVPITKPSTVNGLLPKTAGGAANLGLFGMALVKGGFSLAGYLAAGDTEHFTSDYNCEDGLTNTLVSTVNIISFDNLKCANPVESTVYKIDSGLTASVGGGNLISVTEMRYPGENPSDTNYHFCFDQYDFVNFTKYFLVHTKSGWRPVTNWPPLGSCSGTVSFWGQTNPVNDYDSFCSSTKSSSCTGEVVVPKSGNEIRQKLSCTVSADGWMQTFDGIDWTGKEGLPLSADDMGCKQAFESAQSGGHVVTNVKVASKSSSTGVETTVLSQDTTDAYRTAVQRDPQCVTVAGTSDACVLILSKALPDGTVRQCSDADVWASCSDWYSEATQSQASGQKVQYRCTYGTATLDPVTGCLQYKDTYKHQYGTVTYTDPDTGQEIDPVTGGVTQAQPDSKNCWSEMISWNPVDWVLTPIKCAAIWAFVPTDTNSWQRVGTAWNSTAPAVVARTLSGGIEMPEAGTGCSGPPLDLKSVSGGYLAYDGYPLSACDEPMRTMAQRFKLIAQVLLMASTLWMVIRNITAMFNVPPPPAAVQPTLF